MCKFCEQFSDIFGGKIVKNSIKHESWKQLVPLFSFLIFDCLIQNIVLL